MQQRTKPATVKGTDQCVTRQALLSSTLPPNSAIIQLVMPIAIAGVLFTSIHLSTDAVRVEECGINIASKHAHQHGKYYFLLETNDFTFIFTSVINVHGYNINESTDIVSVVCYKLTAS